jgi:hypothetical protein
MKKLLLTGIAVLSVFIASAAHAGMCTLWQCGKQKVQACAIHEWNGGGYEISFLGLKKPGIRARRFNWRNNDTASLNGKRCIELNVDTEEKLKSECVGDCGLEGMGGDGP